ncbi:polyadenylate-binding protein-interacting protein 1-like isoform X2 [Limulus polyphemus]|uniref:Polyadenylate-binding protein-interacting protein 1-like isoform X2 n=1 Tax=Limulus polyphemus TaxID=6850 RepID=A0ABM1BDT7_LIMPO|nr:polyadenylate-binding protein-interacting protein 1-like isoform X2 [Limulus polyphemus]
MEGDGVSPVIGRGRGFPKERKDLRRPVTELSDKFQQVQVGPDINQPSVPEIENVVYSGGSTSSSCSSSTSSSARITIRNTVPGSREDVDNDRSSNVTVCEDTVQQAASEVSEGLTALPVPLNQPANSILSPFAKEFVPQNTIQQSCILHPDYQERMGDFNDPSVQGSVESFPVSEFEQSDQDNIDSYTISELKDFIFKITLDPGEYDPLVESLVNMLRSSVADEETMCTIADTIFDQAISEPNFTYSAARLCNHLSQNLEVTFGNFRDLILQRCLQEYTRHTELLVSPNDEACVEGFTIFMGELFSQLEVVVGEVKEKLWILGKKLTELLITLLNHPTENNLRCVCKVLKFTGATLEDYERQMTEGNVAAEMDKIFMIIKDIADNSDIRSNTKNLLMSIVELRASDWARTESSPVEQNDPLITDNYLYSTVFYGPDEQPISLEEVVLLQNSCNLDGFSSIMNGFYVGEDPEAENMDDEMEAAFEEFLLETGQ